MKTWILFFCCLIFSVGYAQQPVWDWAKGAGGPGNDVANVSYTSDNGYTFVSGHIADTVVFGQFGLPGTSPYEMFLAMYAPWGDCMWAVRCPYASLGTAITGDQAGNCYVVASNFTFDHLAKYDANGNLVWITPFSSTPNAMRIGHVEFTASNGIWVTGRLNSGSHVFGSDTLSGPVSFIASYDANGIATGATAIGVTGGFRSGSLTHDGSGNVFLCGNLDATDTIGQFTCVESPLGSSDFCLVKLDPSLNVEWVETGSGSGEGSCIHACPDELGGCFVTGSVWYDYEVIQGDTVYGSTPNIQGSCSFLAYFDSNGTLGWLLKGSVGVSYFNDIDMHNQVLWITGFTYSNTFSIGNLNMSNFIGNAGFVIGVDMSGTPQHLVPCPRAFCASVNIDTAGGIYIAGYYKSPPVFESYTIPVFGSEDIFVAKLRTGAVGIADQTSENNISFVSFANSETWQLQIGNSAMVNEPLTLELHDMTGRVVKVLPVNDLLTDVDCSDLAAGMYSWSVSGNNAQFFAAGKFVVQ
ncbi:MAG TPA: hypothetical protein VK826_00320 [Bacteroidia bacterium]|nr:hypothetical protein [Bacteroidia bacterium]